MNVSHRQNSLFSTQTPGKIFLVLCFARTFFSYRYSFNFSSEIGLKE